MKFDYRKFRDAHEERIRSNLDAIAGMVDPYAYGKPRFDVDESLFLNTAGDVVSTVEVSYHGSGHEICISSKKEIGRVDFLPAAQWPDESTYTYALEYNSDLDLDASAEKIRDWGVARLYRFRREADRANWCSGHHLRREISREVAAVVMGRGSFGSVFDIETPDVSADIKQDQRHMAQISALEAAKIDYTRIKDYPLSAPNRATPRALRAAAHLTQAQLAAAGGVSTRWVQKLESGEIKPENITLKNALALAAALGVEPKDLIYAKEEKQK